MSESHGGPVKLKSIAEIAEFIRNLLPANIPENYAVKPMFDNIAKEEDIRKGVAAFRDFLYVFCDRMVSDGQIYFKATSNPKNATDYPFLYNITDFLVDIGYYGKLSTNGDSLMIIEIPSFKASIDAKGKKRPPGIPVSKQKDCLKFLTLCGFVFTDTDSEIMLLSYPDNPALITGLKVMSVVDMELRVKRYVSDQNHDNILRCDYRAIKAEAVDPMDIMKDVLRSLPEEVQKFAFDLHKRYTDMGLTCAVSLYTFEARFAYADIRKSKKVLTTKEIHERRIWEFSISLRHGCCLLIRAKKMDKYSRVVEKLPPLLKEMIARGYGCDRKFYDRSCQMSCQGFRIPLDSSILDIAGDIKTWLDNEISC